MRSTHAAPDAPVLIVEDDADTARIFGMELKSAGFTVQIVPDGESALSFLEHGAPKAAVIDLPTIDGLELIRRLRARHELADTPIALVTGDYMLDDTVTSQLEALQVHVYFKPIWTDELVEIVRALTA